MKGGLLSTFSLRKKIMKNLTMNHPTNIFRTILSGLKETARGFFSMSDGNQFSIQDINDILPPELSTSLSKIDDVEKRFVDTGILDYSEPQIQEKTKTIPYKKQEAIQNSIKSKNKENSNKTFINKDIDNER